MAPTRAVGVIIATLLVFCAMHIDASRVYNAVDNCGARRVKCPSVPHSDRFCKSGRCGFRCKGSYRDCDCSKRNGCEVDVKKDPRNCGRCGRRCPVPANSKPTCNDGKCAFLCKLGFVLSNHCCIVKRCPPPPRSPPPPPSSPPPPPPDSNVTVAPPPPSSPPPPSPNSNVTVAPPPPSSPPPPSPDSNVTVASLLPRLK